MSVTDKIEEAKRCFDNVKKSGRNNYQKYDYLETKDIFPIVRSICQRYKLKTSIKPNIKEHYFVLTITDKEDNSWEEFIVPYSELTANDAGKYMQDFGRCQTYAQRYLYIQAFEIAVSDEIDNKDQRKQVPLQKQNMPVKPIVEEKTDEITEQDVKEALDKVYNIIIDAGKEFNTASALFQLKRQYKDQPQLISACKNALETYTAKVKK